MILANDPLFFGHVGLVVSGSDGGAGPAPGLHEPGGLELLVRAGHGVYGEAEVGGQRSHRGEAVFWKQAARPDEPGELSPDLLERRLCCLLVNDDPQVIGHGATLW